MADLLSIKKFSELSGVDVSKLRFYEKIGLFSPVKRHPMNDYRYYSMAQLFALNFITTLSDMNFPLKTIAALRRERNPVKILQLLAQQEKELHMEIKKLSIRASILHARRELIDYGLIVTQGFKVVDGERISGLGDEEGAEDVD